LTEIDNKKKKMMDFLYHLPPPIYLIAWIGILFLLSYFSGWNKLAEKYRCNHLYKGPWKGWQWGQIGGVGYKCCLWVAKDAEGIYIRTGPLFLFRAFHPPLFISWSAIKSMRKVKYWWGGTVEIQLNNSDVEIWLDSAFIDKEQHFVPSAFINWR
jgi:hypothetical protein